MALITWGPILTVGHKEIDEQHQKLVALVNQLNDAMHAGQGKEALQRVLAELVRYTQYHFGTEERLMAANKYPLSAEHKAEHVKFVADVGAFKKKFDAGNATLSVEIMNFLRDWLGKHILQTDKKLALALRGAAPKQSVHA
ncbi:MAG: hemerythrin family protein [Burkholderiales bacterium]|nr:hemerythrin family protein [Burkholderiales bacterium]